MNPDRGPPRREPEASLPNRMHEVPGLQATFSRSPNLPAFSRQSFSFGRSSIFGGGLFGQHLFDTDIHQQAEPEGLQEEENEPLLAVEETEA